MQLFSTCENFQGRIQKLFHTGIRVWSPNTYNQKNLKNFEKSKVNKFVVCNHKSQQVQNQKRINLTMKFKALNTLNTTKHHVLWGSFTLTQSMSRSLKSHWHISYTVGTSVDASEERD